MLPLYTSSVHTTESEYKGSELKANTKRTKITNDIQVPKLIDLVFFVWTLHVISGCSVTVPKLYCIG